jgi:SHS2 domain-containing protein
MKVQASAGFRELGHGADVALEVWAPDLPGVFRQAASGMMALMGVETAGGQGMERALMLAAPDDESLLVALLSQILFILEQERLVFSVADIVLAPGRLDVTLAGAPLLSIQREIKAVTFNDLAIRRSDGCLKVVIVFDL